MSGDSFAQLGQENHDLFDTYCSTCKDFFKENLKERGLREPLRRVFLIGRLKYAERNEIKNHHDEMVKNINKNLMESCSKISGLMVIDKSLFYHVAEGSDEVLNEVIKRTANFVSKELMYDAKVIRTSSIIFRYFEYWNSCIILSPEYIDTPIVKQKGVTESNIPTLARMIQQFEDVIFVLASYVRYLKDVNVEEKINDLVPTSALPFESELEALHREPFFITVQKYTERYLTPQDYTSYIEEEWPPTGPVHDAKDYFEELELFEKNIDESLKIEEDLKKKKARYGAWWWTQ